MESKEKKKEKKFVESTLQGPVHECVGDEGEEAGKAEEEDGVQEGHRQRQGQMEKERGKEREKERELPSLE